MSHGFGGLPEDGDYRVNGSVTNQLISLDRDCQTINAMPRMSGIPVNFRPIEAPLPTRNGSGGDPISGRLAPAGLHIAAAASYRTGHRRGRSLLRSEEHTSELQSLMRISYGVFCLKKKQM